MRIGGLKTRDLSPAKAPTASSHSANSARRRPTDAQSVIARLAQRGDPFALELHMHPTTSATATTPISVPLMSSVSSSRAAPPPSHQEVTRKLSVHSKPTIKKPTLSTAPVSGNESDSDSMFSPEAALPSPLSATGMYFPGALTQPPLQSIAERRSGSGGEESEEDEEDEEGGWRAETLEQEQARGSHDETVLKTGYLWKKGERRKTWKKRWFVLRPAHLAFYKTAAEYKLLRLLDLSEIHSCTPVQLKKHANTFGMVSPTRTFYLQAESPQQVSEWIKAITDARTALLATSTQNSATTAPIPIPRSASLGRQAYQPPGSPTLSHSPYNHHLTSSESEDASPSKPRPFIGNSLPSTSMTTAAELSSPPRQSGTQDGSKFVLSGYLMKCGSRRHTWHNRWFVLSGDKLVYSRSHMDTKPHRSIPLTQFLDALEFDLPPHRHTPASPPALPPQIVAAGEEPDGTAGKHTFKIVTTKRTLLLCAPSEEEEIKWLSAVRALIARRSVVPGDSAAASASTAVGASAGSTGAAPSRTGALSQSTPAGASASHDGQAAQGHGGGSSANPGPPATLPVAASAPASVSGGGGTPQQRRRGSVVRRLSLSSGGGLLGGSPHATGVVQES